MTAARKRISNPLQHYPLGRFLYAQEIDQKQYDAGMYFAWLWKTMAKIRGQPSPNIRALDYGAGAPGLSVHPEGSAEWNTDIRRKWQNALRGIYDANADHGRTTGPIYELLKRTLLEDIGPRNAQELGSLRIGLNAINHARGV